jgi:hypothetical protein
MTLATSSSGSYVPEDDYEEIQISAPPRRGRKTTGGNHMF